VPIGRSVFVYSSQVVLALVISSDQVKSVVAFPVDDQPTLNDSDP